MGSLPNLDHVLDRREREKERVLARERAREREFCHDLDTWRERALSLQARHRQRTAMPQRRVIRTRSSGNTHHLTDEPIESLFFLGTKNPASTTGSGKSHRIPHHTFTQLPGPNPPIYHHVHHFHHTVIQPQNSNSTQICSSVSRRRESANSSIGATSVRRLLTVNRGCRHKIPVHVRANVIKNFIFLVIGHGLISATLVPLMGLQGSNSIWFNAHRKTFDSILVTKLAEGGEDLSTTETSETDFLLVPGPPNGIGSLLLSLSFLLTSGMCFLAGMAIKKMGHYSVIFCGYVGIALFLACHVLPNYYTLLPAYTVLGIVLGPLYISKLNLIIVMANKLSCGQHECCNATISTPTASQEPNHEEIGMFPAKPPCSRDQNIRRLARWFNAVQDFGILCGAVIASFLLTCSAFDEPNSVAHSMCLNGNNQSSSSSYMEPFSFSQPVMVMDAFPVADHLTATPPLALPVKNESAREIEAQIRPELNPVIGAVLTKAPVSENFDVNSHGQRICGASSCPVWMHMHASYIPFYMARQRNESGQSYESILYTNIRMQVTIAVYLILCLAAIGSTIGLRNFANKKNLAQQQARYNTIPGLADTLLFAGPMAFFIGTEQSYLLADFMKAYVSCSLGPHMVAATLVCMAIMQLIASCTLSMLLRHTKRLVVILAGFFFHACLLLVLSRWKPAKDDSALFFVIAAAWGVCNAVWETLLFTLLSLTHKNFMVDVLSPIQAIKYLAMGITFGAHGFLCEYSKIIVLAILLIVSVPPYTNLEMRLEVQRKASQNNAKSIPQIPTL